MLEAITEPIIHLLIGSSVIVSILSLLAMIRYRSSKRRRLKSLTLRELKSMSPREFEHAIAELLRALEYKDVKVVGGSGDLAIDVIARYNNRRVVLQCKRYNERKVTSPEMQMFIGMIVTEHNADKGIYVTTSSFTRMLLCWLGDMV
jgi:restriction system protein